MTVSIGLMTVIPPFWQLFVKGAILVLVVTLNWMLVRDKTIT